MNEIEKLQREIGIVLDPERIPKHIAIIMDGNGRWATARGLPRIVGHKKGYETVLDMVRACGELHLSALTLYTFSTENWRRPKDEVEAIMQLIEWATVENLPTMMENDVRLQVCGRIGELSESMRLALADVMEKTSGNSGLVLNLAINYGGRREILDAAQEASRRVLSGEIGADDVSEEYFSGLMYTAGLPDPDLLIRTAGELRVSNFLLWQIAYAEIWVTETLWPDFTRKDLLTAISDYQKRTRKFGAVPPPG